MYLRREDKGLFDVYQQVKTGKRKIVLESEPMSKVIQPPKVVINPKKQAVIDNLKSIGIDIPPNASADDYDRIVKGPLMKKALEQGMSQDEADYWYKKTKREFTLEADIIAPEVWSNLLDKVTRARVKLFDKAPFFEAMLAKLKVVYTRDGVDTMAVDNYGNIYINPEFALEDLTEEEVTGVLAHEVFHIVNLTFLRREHRDHELWNIATDYIMNKELLKDKFHLPKLGCLPYEKNGRWLIYELKGKKDIKDLDITEFDEEDLYQVLEKIAEDKDQNGQGNQPVEIKAGDIIYDNDNGKYGKVTKVDKKTGKVYSDEIPESQVQKHLK